MLFAVKLAAMNGGAPVLNALDAILARIEDDVHELELIEADEIETTAWYRSLRPDRRKLLEEIAENSLHRTPRVQGPHLRRVDVENEGTAMRARGIAYTPLLVLLENDVSDAALVEAALRMFAQAATLHLCFGAPSKLDPPAFEMTSRGGSGQLPTLIERLCDQAAMRGRPDRLVVVADSDKEWPTDVKEHAEAIRIKCQERGVRFVILQKRTVENYIPDAAWKHLAQNPDYASIRPAIEAILRLSPEQRDHVHITKSGSGPWNTATPKASELFHDVSSADFDVLRRTSLKGKNDGRLILILKDDRAKDAFTREDLMARDHQDDLLTLVGHIEDEL